MAILGLVIQEPDSIAGVGRRLVDRFPEARFARNAAHNNLPSLRRQGLVRLVDAGAQRGLDRYEVTPEGTAHFRAWMRATQATLPVLRDALRVTLEEVASEAELARSIAAIGEQERACVAEYEAAVRRLRAAERAERLRAKSSQDWRAAVQHALMSDEVTYWGFRAARLKRLREGLQFTDDGDENSDDS